MAKQSGPIKLVGTFDNLCFYIADGEYRVRKASSLTGKTVKTDNKFRRTMEEASLFGRASRIGSIVYQALPETFRQHWMFKAFTGEASQWLRQGKTVEEATMILLKMYAEVWLNREAETVSPESRSTTTNQQRKPIQCSIIHSIAKLPEYASHRQSRLKRVSNRRPGACPQAPT